MARFVQLSTNGSMDAEACDPKLLLAAGYETLA